MFTVLLLLVLLLLLLLLVQSSAQQAMQECEKLFSDMLRSIEKMQQEMSKLISSNKRAALSNAEGHMERLTHEIADLRRRDGEITQLSRTEDHIHFIQVAMAIISSTDNVSVCHVSVVTVLHCVTSSGFTLSLFRDIYAVTFFLQLQFWTTNENVFLDN